MSRPNDMTPREYLSWSSLDLLERSEERWKAQYLRGEKPPTSRAMTFGSKVADALETGEMTGDLELDLVIEQFPKLGIQDQMVMAELNRGRGKNPIPLLAKPDTRNEDYSAFREYKTGTEPWTQKKVDAWGQITFYAVVGYIIRGKLVPEIWLDWAPTQRNEDGTISVMGTVKSFRTNRTMADILRMMLRMRRAWDRIEKLTEQELF